MSNSTPPVISLEEVGSTNDFAQELLRNHHVVNGTCIAASFQSEGKGQRGNKWFSERNQNLTFSVIFLPETLHIGRHFMLNIVFSLAVKDYLSDCGIHNAAVKWPNDVYIHGQKLGGILIENSIRGEMISAVIAGFGININQEQFDNTILPIPTSTSLQTGKKSVVKTELEHILPFVFNRFQQLDLNKDDELKEEYKSSLYKINESAIFTSGAEEWSGIIRNITPEGKLIIEKSNGKLSEYNFKEVQLVL
jgi:BirA family transcriptional regulator, biotin operon repressor / biotin---[acetyl-CoA-carboxylase] ligase